MLIFACVRNYIRALLVFSGAVFGLQTEDPLLELHQLTPQSVLLSQDAGDHGLGLVSGQVRLEAHFRLYLFHTESTVHRQTLFFIHVDRHNQVKFIPHVETKMS